MKISPGDSIGRYHILEPLGEGGMASVFKAYDTRLERDVAIKFLRTELFGSAVLEQLFKRFEREAKALARLSHFHIVKIHDYGDYENTPYLVMEYVPGGTLKSRMGKPMDWREAIELILPVARALEYAHRHGVLHRDVKPSNILITEGGEPLLSDFGIAKILESGESQAITGTGVGIGTPEYMAPEQGLAKEIDARTDVYSLGIVLYEMVTGRKPYLADTPTAVLIKQIHDPLPNPKGFAPELPESVERILVKALAKQPENRYANMEEFAHAMERLVKDQPEEAQAAETVVVEWRPKLSEQPATIISQPVSEKAVEEPAAPLPHEESEVPAAEAQPAEPPHAEAPVEQPAALSPKKRWNRWWLAAPILMVAAAAVGLALWLIPPSPASPTPPAPTFTFVPPSPVPTKITEPTPLPVIAKPSAGEPLKIGVIAPFSGNQVVYGASAEKGILLAVEQWNSRGGVLDRPVLAVTADDGCGPDMAVAAATRLIDEEKVKFIVGAVCSRASIPVARMVNLRGVIQITAASTNPEVTVDENGNVRPFSFRACLVDPFQGHVAARFAFEDLKAKRAFVVFEQNDSYEVGLGEAFAAHFRNLGGTYTQTMTYTAGQQDLSEILKQIDDVRPDVIYLPALVGEVNYFINQARAHGIKAPFIGADGWASPELDLKITQGSFFTTHYWEGDPRPEVVEFRNAFGERFKDEQGKPIIPDSFAALSYDATNLLLQAITNANSTDPGVVRKALEEIKFQGITGSIIFDKQHNPEKPAVILAVTPDGVRFERQVMP